MNFSQIKCFLAAAECLSFTRASERLFISQPVLSRQIAAMEDELDIELFVREKKSVRLTKAGEAMAEGLVQLAKGYHSIVERATALHLGYSGSLSIGMVEGQQLCPPYSDVLSRFRDRHPAVKVNLLSFSMSEMREALFNDEIDAAFAADFNFEGEPDIELIRVATARVMLVIPKTHPKAKQKELKLSDFRDDTFLALSENETPFIRAAAEQSSASSEDFHPHTLKAPTIGALALWLEAGFGIFPLNENHSLRNNPNLLFIELPELGTLTEVVAWKKENKNPLRQIFVDLFDGLAN
ncbi:MAG: LysR family transcriptional regulator [Oscillospiraceae bacterium]|jgi:DNA-binding transcriptional LysR family regulator|nr:LysR family transcriptional regulator [Oscillospiraceae bacterium]